MGINVFLIFYDMLFLLINLYCGGCFTSFLHSERALDVTFSIELTVKIGLFYFKKEFCQLCPEGLLNLVNYRYVLKAMVLAGRYMGAPTVPFTASHPPNL